MYLLVDYYVIFIYSYSIIQYGDVMAQALNRIVEALMSSKLTILNEEEAFLLYLIECYCELKGYSTLKNFVKKIKESKIHIKGRARYELLSLARAVRVNVLQQARLRRETPIVSYEELQKLLGESK